MSHPVPEEVNLLDQVADECREVFSERGHLIEVALQSDPAFGSGWARAALTRDLVIGAASAAASRVGLEFRPVNGIGRELRCLSTVDRRYRLRRASVDSSGEIVVNVNSESALAESDPGEGLYRVEQWVLGWTLTPDELIGDVFVAQVIGYIPGRPGRLELGTPIPLGQRPRPVGGFLPTDDGLPGFDDEGDEDAPDSAVS